MTSGIFPGQRKFPVSLFKGSHRPAQENLVSGTADFPAGGQQRQSTAGDASCL